MRRKGIFIVAALGLSWLLSLCLAEVVLRVLEFGHPVFHRRDLQYGRTLIPGAEGWYTREGSAYVRINESGFRDYERELVKPANTYRIAILGDSYTEALQVDIADTFWSLLQARLAMCENLPAPGIEVLNFGVSGYSTAQQFLQLENSVWDYGPDLVLLAFVSGNDVADNYPALSPGETPFFVFEDGGLRLDNRFVEDPVFQRKTGIWGNLFALALQNSNILQLANVARINLRDCGRVGSCGQDQKVGAPGEAGILDAVFKEPADTPWYEAWLVTEGIVAMMNDSVQEHHAQLAILVLTQGVQVHPRLEVRRRYMETIGVSDLRYPERRMRGFAERAKIPLLTLAEPFSEYALRTGEYLHGFPGPDLGKGHWNERGHQLASELSSEWICDSGFWLETGNEY